jgi:hypothetical protein
VQTLTPSKKSHGLTGSLPLALGLIIVVAGFSSRAAKPDLWDLARQPHQAHRFSTLFTAHDVREYLSTPEGLASAMDWCKKTGVTKVYIEEFRDGYQAQRATLVHARDEFRAQGFIVSGCVTTTRVGKPSTGWKEVACCYTDQATQDKLQAIFQDAAGLFDEIMIDDFWFTDCSCAECDAARRAQTVTVGGRKYPVAGDSWEDYRCELMLRLSQDRLLGPAKKVNPKVRLIIKYPQWYDNFHVRGYDVVRETKAFDEIWVGTETRDYRDPHWGGTPQYEGYFLMRWLGGIGGAKCGGGWFDSLGTTPLTYVEQARQTVLAGARESMLFSFGGLQRGSAQEDVRALRRQIPALLALARDIQGRQPLGVAAYKPPNSHPEKEARVFDFVGMLGIPLVPCREFPTRAPAAFFSIHSLKDEQFAARLTAFIKTGKPVLLTDGLVAALSNRVDLARDNVHILPVNGDPKSLLLLDQQKLDKIREPLLHSLKVSFAAPNRVSLYLFKGRDPLVENFNEEPVDIILNGKTRTVPARGWTFSGDPEQARTNPLRKPSKADL